MVVDDEATRLSLLGNALASQGYRLRLAADGADPGETGVRHVGFFKDLTETVADIAPRIGAALSLDELEKAHIGAVLATAGTLDQAAKTLGIDASTLYRKRKQYNL